ncbi:MAG: hypothetical protein JJ974_09040 [Phycisphaerales bacterium]|nr:hypothetical protein [Phycisphaerales bacterium]
MKACMLGYSVDRIAEIADRLFDLDESFVGKARVEGGWSRKEILGHLCDSANVNQQRIIESVLGGSIVFEGYAHRDWVRMNGYQGADWEELVTLWGACTMQLCVLVDGLDDAVVEREHAEHSYATTAFRELPADVPSTLGYLIEDFFAHLEYHMAQILED